MRAALADIRDLTASDKESFDADRTAQQALACSLAVIGEAARAMSRELHDRYPDVPWRVLITERNVVVHAYHSLDADNFGRPRGTTSTAR
jgi:uncharacterized protein with HEPN domain